MINARTLAKLTAPLLFLVAANCSSDMPTQPDVARANTSLVGGLVGTVGGTLGGVVGNVAPGLLACPTSRSYSASEVVGPAGGVIRVGPHSLVIPQGALSSDVRISATAPAGDYVEVQFAPHGLRFARPAALTMSYRQCGVVQGLLMGIVYIDDHHTILEIITSSNNLVARTVTGGLDHFSGYAVATRRPRSRAAY